MEGFMQTEDGVKLCYRVSGTGARTLLFLHGWGGNQSTFAPAIAALEGEYTVVTYDHRGFGASDRPACGYSVECLARDLKELLEHLELTDVVLVGWSMGGVVAARYLHIYGQDRAAALVLVDVNTRILCDRDYPHGFYDGAYTREAAFRDVALMSRDFRLFVQEMPEKANMTLFDDAMRAAFVDKVLEQNPIPYPPIAMWLSLCEQDLTQAFSALELPVLFCHGGTSTYCPPKACAHVMSLLRRGVVEEFPVCSHFIPIERPEPFARALDRFVREKI